MVGRLHGWSDSVPGDSPWTERLEETGQMMPNPYVILHNPSFFHAYLWLAFYGGLVWGRRAGVSCVGILAREEGSSIKACAIPDRRELGRWLGALASGRSVRLWVLGEVTMTGFRAGLIIGLLMLILASLPPFNSIARPARARESRIVNSTWSF